MKTLYWDAINPLTGRPFTWDDPNLRWGDPSYYLEPGDPGFVPYPGPEPGPAKKPFRHASKKTISPSNINTNTVMSTFNYNVVPKSGGGFTTRPALGAEFEDAALDALVAADTGVAAAQCAAVLAAYVNRLLQCASGCAWSHDFHGLLSVRPTSGGSQTMPDGFNNAAEINAGVSLTINPTMLDAWRSDLSIHSLGQLGLVTPVVDSIINLQNHTEDTYTPGEIIQLTGNHLDFDKADSAQGVFYATAAAPGTKVRFNIYGAILPAQAQVVVPAGLSGPLTISVVNKISGSLRSSTYVTAIG